MLVLDDAAFGGRVVDTLAERLPGTAVEVVQDPAAVFDRLAAGDVDCLVVASGPPDDGTRSFVDAVRDADSSVPLIFVTADASASAVEATIQAGADDHLSAPDGGAGGLLLARRVRAAVEEHRSRRLLAERNRRLETLISNLPGVVYRCRNEPDWPMQFVRGECAELTGYDADAIERGEVSWGEDVIHPEDQGEVWDRVQDALEAHDAFEVTYRIRTRGGEVRHVWERGRGLYDDGELDAIEGFITDVTERERREERLQRERDRLENFVDVVSHDLRNPLNVAQARLELARTDDDPVHLEAVDRSLDRMETLVEDLLALAREGDDVTDPRPVAFPEVVERCWEQVDTDDARLVCEGEGAVVADESRLRQLLENLFRNSVEHGSTGSRRNADDAVEHGSTSNRPGADDTVEHGSVRGETTAGDGGSEAPSGTAGGPTVRVRLTDDGFVVADDGPGIPAGERERVFEAGYSTRSEGTGFGLPIVENIAAAHGWDVSVGESPAGGASFEFEGVSVRTAGD